MKIDAGMLALASGLGVGIVWVVCFGFVAFMPQAMSGMAAHMLHLNSKDVAWELTLSGFIIGGISWLFFTALVVWLIAIMYNRLLEWRLVS